MASDDPLVSDGNLDEIRDLLAEFRPPDEGAAQAAVDREATLTKPAGALGRLEELVQWLAMWQGRHPPKIDHPRVAIFAGSHGVAEQRVSAYPPSVTGQMVQNFIDGGAAINQLCSTYDADLRVYEMALDQPTADFTRNPAMDDMECARAMSYGMMAVEEGIDILCLGEMGIANTTSAAAICLALFGGNAPDWTGTGTGVDGPAFERKIDVVRRAAELHAPACRDPLDVLARLGGLEIAAIAGAIISARLARVPVVLDGFVSTAAAAVLFAVNESALDHCLVSHRSAEKGHGRLLETLDRSALFEFDMRLGEGTGAALTIPMLQGACACHSGMATFNEAGVSSKVES